MSRYIYDNHTALIFHLIKLGNHTKKDEFCFLHDISAYRYRYIIYNPSICKLYIPPSP